MISTEAPGEDHVGGASAPTSDTDYAAPKGSRWLSIREIATDLSISVHTAYKWSARGEPWFPKSIRLRNGDLRVRRDWYDEWLTGMEVP